MQLDDYLAIEEPLVERLREAVPELVTVTTAAELEDVANLRQKPPPAAIVIYDGDDVPQTPQSEAARGQRQVVLQRWLVVIAVQNVRDQRQGSSVRREAGPLMVKVIRAVAGWQPPVPNTRPLMRAPGTPGPAFEAGYGYFPLLFIARVFT